MKRIKDPKLAELLAAAAAPEPADAADERGLADVLAAYRAAESASSDAAPGVRAPRRRTGGFALKFAAAIAAAATASVAAAGAGVLPGPIQRIAHDYLGGVGIPAPNSSSPSPTAAPSRSTRPSASQSPAANLLSPVPQTSGPASPSASASASAGAAVQPGQLIALCRIVVQDGKSWHSDLDQAQRAVVVTAAGGEPKVLPYCTNLLATPTTPAPAPSTAAPSPSASDQHGHGHPSHPPNPKPSKP